MRLLQKDPNDTAANLVANLNPSLDRGRLDGSATAPRFSPPATSAGHHSVPVPAVRQIDGVRSLTIKPAENGRSGFAVEIDGRSYFMNRAIGETLVALSANTGINPDMYVGWKSTRELELQLGISHGALSSRIRRLRRFFDHRCSYLSGAYVLADRKRGFRFALRRRWNS